MEPPPTVGAPSCENGAPSPVHIRSLSPSVAVWYNRPQWCQVLVSRLRVLTRGRAPRLIRPAHAHADMAVGALPGIMGWVAVGPFRGVVRRWLATPPPSTLGPGRLACCRRQAWARAISQDPPYLLYQVGSVLLAWLRHVHQRQHRLAGGDSPSYPVLLGGQVLCIWRSGPRCSVWHLGHLGHALWTLLHECPPALQLALRLNRSWWGMSELPVRPGLL
jgi:hypothetical protein